MSPIAVPHGARLEQDRVSAMSQERAMTAVLMYGFATGSRLSRPLPMTPERAVADLDSLLELQTLPTMNPWYRQRKPFRRQMLDHIIAKFVGKVEEETGSGSVIMPSPPLLLRGNDERADFIRFLRLLHGLVRADPDARDLAMRSVYFREVHPKSGKKLSTVSNTAATMPTIEQNSSNAKGPLESRTAEGHAEDGSATVFVSELSSDWTVVDIEDTQSTVC